VLGPRGTFVGGGVLGVLTALVAGVLLTVSGVRAGKDSLVKAVSH